MKVLHIVNFYPERGGPYTATKELLTRLYQKGVYIKVLSSLPPNYDKKKKSFLNTIPFEVIYVKELLPPSIYRSFSLRFIYKVPQLAKDFDIIHLAMIFDFYSLPVLFINKKLVITLCGEFMPQAYKSKKIGLIKKHLYMQTIGKLILNKASAIHALSEKEKKHFAEYFPKFEEKIKVIPNGLDFEQYKKTYTQQYESNTQHLFTNFTDEKLNKITTLNYLQTLQKLPRDSKRILFLGRIAKIKGLDLLIPAFAKLAKERTDIYLIIAGKDDGDGYEKIIRDLVIRYNIEEKVIFVGFVREEEKKELFSRCNLFVMPSYSENFGIAIVEAIAAGLPVIITNQVGIADDIQKYNLGFLAYPSVECLYCTIKRVLEIETSKLIEYSRKAQQKVYELYNIDKVANMFIELYKNIL